MWGVYLAYANQLVAVDCSLEFGPTSALSCINHYITGHEEDAQANSANEMIIDSIMLHTLCGNTIPQALCGCGIPGNLCFYIFWKILHIFNLTNLMCKLPKEQFKIVFYISVTIFPNNTNVDLCIQNKPLEISTNSTNYSYETQKNYFLN